MSDNEPLVSICIPTYNRIATIKRAVDSALNQPYRNIEVIVSDNDSNDGTEELIRSISDPRLRYQKHQQNMGSQFNLRSVVDASTGDYILLLSSDDYIEPPLIERAVAVLEKYPRIGIYYANYVVSPDGIRKRKRWDRGVRSGACFNAEVILRGNIIGLLTAVFRKKAYMECGPWADHPCCDWMLWIRLLLSGWGMWGDKAVLGTYSTNPDTNSANLDFMPERVEELDRYIMAEVERRNLSMSAWRAARRGVAGRYYSAGRAARDRGDCRLALKMFRHSFKLWPMMRWRAIRQLALVRTYLRMIRPVR